MEREEAPEARPWPQHLISDNNHPEVNKNDDRLFASHQLLNWFIFGCAFGI
jgi:hypothetical protein